MLQQPEDTEAAESRFTARWKGHFGTQKVLRESISGFGNVCVSFSFFLLSVFASLSHLLFTQKQDSKVGFLLGLGLSICTSQACTPGRSALKALEASKGEKSREMPASQFAKNVSPVIELLVCSYRRRPGCHQQEELQGLGRISKCPLWSINPPSVSNWQMEELGPSERREGTPPALGGWEPIQGTFCPTVCAETALGHARLPGMDSKSQGKAVAPEELDLGSKLDPLLGSGDNPE